MLEGLKSRAVVQLGPALILCMTIILLSKPVQSWAAFLPAELLDGTADAADVNAVTIFKKQRTWLPLRSTLNKQALAWSERIPALDSSAENEPDTWLHLTMPIMDDDSKEQDKISLIYLSNDKLQSNWGENTSYAATLRDNDLLEELEHDNEISPQKRTWKNINVGWGKRRNAPVWNKFRGAWGKREPGWNNLKNMWGKRSSNKHWQKLQHPGWGKRDKLVTNYDESNNN